MASLFKFLPSKYLDSLVGRGELLFRSLSYFRNYEELTVRGDRHEGRRLFQPSSGLEVTKTDSGEKLLLPLAFKAGVRDREIFVFCLSLKRTPELADEFNTDSCVEIQDPVALISRIRTALALRKWVKHARLLHGPVDYYSATEPPYAEWAVPERMVMRKTDNYRHQAEYRFAFGRDDAWKVYNVDTKITAMPADLEPTLDGHPEHTLKVGSLAKICRIHTGL